MPEARVTPEPRDLQLLAWRLLYLALQGGSSLALVFLVLLWAPSDAASAFLVAQGTVVAVQTIADLGISQGAATWLSRARHERPQDADALMATFMTAARYTATAATAGAALSAVLFLGNTELAETLVLCAPLAGVAVVVAALDGTLRSNDEIRTPVILAGMSRLGMLVGGGAGALIAHSAQGVAITCSVVTVVASAPALHRLWSGRADRTTWRRHRREVFRACLPIAGSQAAVVLSARITTPLAAGIGGTIIASAFEVAWRVYQLVQYALGGAMTAYFPKIAREQAAGKHETLSRTFVLSIVGGLATGAVMFVTAPIIGGLAPDRLADPTTEAIEVLAFATPFALVWLPASAALSTSARRALLWISGAGAVANLVFSTTLGVTGLSPATGPAAAAVVTGLCAGVVAWRGRNAPVQGPPSGTGADELEPPAGVSAGLPGGP